MFPSHILSVSIGQSPCEQTWAFNQTWSLYSCLQCMRDCSILYLEQLFMYQCFFSCLHIWHSQAHRCSPFRITTDNSWVMNLHLHLVVISDQFGIRFPWSGVKLSAEPIRAVTPIVTLDESNKKKKKRMTIAGNIFSTVFITWYFVSGKATVNCSHVMSVRPFHLIHWLG